MKYRKKPIVIEAFQMTKARRMDNRDWPSWLNMAWQYHPITKGATEMGKILRQGDVLLTLVAMIPAGTKEEDFSQDSRVVLAYGEATGHTHAIVRDPQTKVLPVRVWSSGAERFIQVMEKTALLHEEHAPIPLDPGIYKVGHQREYHPEEIRRVAD